MTATPSLDGRTVIVTGAAGPLGRSLAVAAAQAGAQVVATDVSQEALADVAAAAAGGGAGRVLPMAADLADTAQCLKLVRRAHIAFGALHGLVCVPAAAEADPVRFREVTDAQWQAVFEVGARAAFVLARAAAGYFLDQGWGRIFNVAAKPDGADAGGRALAGPLNAALEAQAACWAADLAGTGVTVNFLVADETIETAAALRWLLSDASDGFTGQRLDAGLWDAALPAAEAAERAAVAARQT